MVRNGDHPGPVDYSANLDVWTIQRIKGWGLHQPWNIAGAICTSCQHHSNSNELRTADPDRGACLDEQPDEPLGRGAPRQRRAPDRYVAAIAEDAQIKDVLYSCALRRLRAHAVCFTPMHAVF